jgi:hypothetical protein
VTIEKAGKEQQREISDFPTFRKQEQLSGSIVPFVEGAAFSLPISLIRECLQWLYTLTATTPFE